VKLGPRTAATGNPAGLVRASQVNSVRWAARLADLASVIAEIRAAGFVSAIAVARELNARGIRPIRADRWSTTSVRFTLSRFSLRRSMAEWRQAQLAAKEAWIAGLAPILADIRRSGCKTLTSIGRELNARVVPSYWGGRWDPSLLHRTLTRANPLFNSHQPPGSPRDVRGEQQNSGSRCCRTMMVAAAGSPGRS
jgi:hypothetical protein